MGASPIWKVYSEDGEYLASTKYIDDASVLAARHGGGSTIRRGHRRVVWTQGIDGDASESFDQVAETAAKRPGP